MSRGRIHLSVALIALLGSATAAAQTLSTTVTAPDGVALATDVYLPLGFAPWPTVLVRTPYGKDGDDTCTVFAALGYACVIQDTRGRFGSSGTDTVFRDDGGDGRATLIWIAGQWWSDGAVCTFGGSALGITQYMMAPDAGEVLRCQTPVVATPDLYHHAMLQGGALRQALMVNWLRGQGAEGFLDEVRSHRLRDSWWDPVDAVDRAGLVAAAGLHIGGWYDIFAQGTLDGFTAFNTRGGDLARGHQYLIMGPWTHAIGERQAGELLYPPSADLELVEMILEWYGHWLWGSPRNLDGWPRARVYLMGAVGEPDAPGNEWIHLPGWPPAARTLDLHLGAGGELVERVPSTGAFELVSDPERPVPTLGGANLFADLEVDGRAMGSGPWDQRPIEDRDDVLTFSTAILTAPLTVIGRIRCTLWILPDTPDLDLAVRVTDVYPDGRSMLVTDGIQRARTRCGDDRECLLTPGEPTAITVDLWSTAMVFNAGHRIRIDVSGSNAPRFEVNPNHGDELDGDAPPRVAHPLVLVGADTPSALHLPIPTVPRRPSGRLGR